MKQTEQQYSTLESLQHELRELKQYSQSLEKQLRDVKQESLAKDKHIQAMEEKIKHNNEQIGQLEWIIHHTLRSYAYRTGKIIVYPAKIMKNTFDKIAKKLARTIFSERSEYRQAATKYRAKITLGNQLDVNFGRHRSGLKYGLQALKKLHNPAGIVLDSFIERTFCWHPRGIKLHTTPWIGFIHVPPHMPDWFFPEQSNQAIFQTAAWQASLPYCQGLYTFSKYHRTYLESFLPLPINNVLLPTETPDLQWSWDRFQRNANKKIVQIGWWLRMLHAIYLLPKTDYQKVFLDANHVSLPYLLQKEREILAQQNKLHETLCDTVQTIHFLANKAYDRLLAENIVLIYLYDASANNTVIECIARNTPILINPIEPVREYLGEDYPFYYNSFAEAAAKAMDMDLVYRTHQYLTTLPLKPKLSANFFLESIASSSIYCNLKEPS